MLTTCGQRYSKSEVQAHGDNGAGFVVEGFDAIFVHGALAEFCGGCESHADGGGDETFAGVVGGYVVFA